ncbi:hypothetical protein ACOME3_007105 [Neoechinorhynchus agilis]
MSVTESIICSYCLNECEDFYGIEANSESGEHDELAILCPKCLSLDLRLDDCYNGQKHREFSIKRRITKIEKPKLISSHVYFEFAQRILHRMRHHGYANWAVISRSIGASDHELVRRFYHQLRARFRLPEMIAKYSNLKCYSFEDLTNSVLSPSIPLPPMYINAKDNEHIAALHLRDDYEREFKNNIESFLVHIRMGVDDNETQHDIDLKIEYLGMYASVLHERRVLRQHARDMSILTFVPAEKFYQEVAERTGTWSKASLREKFSRSNSSGEHARESSSSPRPSTSPKTRRMNISDAKQFIL